MNKTANSPFTSAVSDGKGKKRMCFINVVPFFPAKVDYMVSEAKRLAETVGLTNPAYSMTLLFLAPRYTPYGKASST